MNLSDVGNWIGNQLNPQKHPLVQKVENMLGRTASDAFYGANKVVSAPFNAIQRQVQPVAQQVNSNPQLTTPTQRFANALPKVAGVTGQQFYQNILGNGLIGHSVGGAISPLSQSAAGGIGVLDPTHSGFQKVGDVLGSVGALAAPGTSLGFGAFGTGIGAAGNFIQGKPVTAASLKKLFNQQTQQGAKFAGGGVWLNPATDLAAQATGRALFKIAGPAAATAGRIGVNALSGGLQFGGINATDAKNNKEALQKFKTGFLQGAAFSALTSGLGEAFKGRIGRTIENGDLQGAQNEIAKLPDANPNKAKLQNLLNTEIQKAFEPTQQAQLGFDLGKKKPVTVSVFRGEGGKNPSSSLDAYGKGTYYTTDPTFAKNYGTVTKSDITLNNPLIIKDQAGLEKLTQDMITAGYKDLSSYASSLGHDGIIDKASDIVLQLPQDSAMKFAETMNQPNPVNSFLQKGADTRSSGLQSLYSTADIPTEGINKQTMDQFNKAMDAGDWQGAQDVVGRLNDTNPAKPLLQNQINSQIQSDLTSIGKNTAKAIKPTQLDLQSAVNAGKITPEEAAAQGFVADPEQRLRDALKQAGSARAKQETIYSAERSKRFGQFASVGKSTQGEAGAYQQLSKLGGSMDKVQIDSLRNSLDQNTIDGLFNKAKDLPSLGDQATYFNGMRKLLGAEGGALPTRGELNVMNKVLQPETVQALIDKRPLMQKVMEGAGNVLALPRSLMSSADMSAPLRQGVLLGSSHPKEFLGSFGKMVQFFFDKNSYDSYAKQLASSPNYQLKLDNGLALTMEPSMKLTDGEEAFMSNLGEKIPIAGKLVAASSRAYS
jgi:hypothetical protein